MCACVGLLRCGQACVSGRVCAGMSGVRLKMGDPGYVVRYRRKADFGKGRRPSYQTG